MKNKNSKHKISHLFYIIMLWIMWFAVIGLMYEFFNGNHFWWRIILIYPFTWVAIKITLILWKK